MTCRNPSPLSARALRPTAVVCRSARGLTFQTCLPITSGSQNQLRLLVSVTDNAWATCTCSAKRLPESAMGSALRIKSSQILVRIGPAQNAASLGVDIASLDGTVHYPCDLSFKEVIDCSSPCPCTACTADFMQSFKGSSGLQLCN